MAEKEENMSELILSVFQLDQLTVSSLKDYEDMSEVFKNWEGFKWAKIKNLNLALSANDDFDKTFEEICKSQQYTEEDK